jgi:hypothetical protein
VFFTSAPYLGFIPELSQCFCSYKGAEHCILALELPAGSAEFPVGRCGSGCAVGGRTFLRRTFFDLPADWVLPSHVLHREVTMNRTNFFVGIFAAGCLAASAVLIPSVGHAQADPRVTKSMETLKAMTAKLGAPKLEGQEAVGGKDAPALYFGTTKINNTFDIVDGVGIQDGQGMTATLFAKGGNEYIRVSTSVPKPDGSGRAIGTVLAGPALDSIKVGKAYLRYQFWERPT